MMMILILELKVTLHSAHYIHCSGFVPLITLMLLLMVLVMATLLVLVLVLLANFCQM